MTRLEKAIKVNAVVCRKNVVGVMSYIRNSNIKNVASAKVHKFLSLIKVIEPLPCEREFQEDYLQLNEYGFMATFLELGEERIRSVLKKAFGIECGELYAVGDDSFGVIMGNNPTCTMQDLEGADTIEIMINADKKYIGSEVHFTESLYIQCEFM
jgi:hypothetical protein